MNNIITYCRVSTEEQKKQGFSLSNQKERLLKFTKDQGYNILMHYEEDYSAKNFNRPGWKELKQYCCKNYFNINKIIFTRWDRFSRNVKQAYEEIEWFKEREIEVYSVDNPLNMDLPESKITLALYLNLSEIENDRLSLRVKEGLNKAKREGCWTSLAPFGYTNYRSPKNKSTLIPDENGKYVLDTFLKLATQKISVRKVWLYMRSKGMIISSSQFYELIRNPVYAGKIVIKNDKNQPIKNIEGLHSPIVPTVLFEKVQTKLEGKSKMNNQKHRSKSSLYLLRGYIKCSKCGKTLTASGSTGSNPNRKYHYYHCSGGCKERFPLKKVHELFDKYLETISINKEQFIKAKKEIKVKIQKKEKSLEEKKRRIKKQISKFQNIIARAEDRFFEELIDPETFKNSKIRYLKKIKESEVKFIELKNFNPVFEYQRRIEKLKKYIDLPEKYRIANIKEKQNLIASIVPNKIILNPT